MNMVMARDPDLVALGGRLSRARLGKALARPDLARAARVDETRLATIEAGETHPTIAELRRIAEALGGLTLTWQDLGCARDRPARRP